MMQTQALYAVLRDFDLANLQQGVVGGQSGVPPGETGAALPGVGDEVRPPVTYVLCDGGRAHGAGAPPEQDAPVGMVPSAPHDRPKDHGGDAKEANAHSQNHAGVPLRVV